MQEALELANQFFSIFKNISLSNILDILLMTAIFYKVLGVIKDTKAAQLIKGFALILVALQVSKTFGFVALTWLIQSTLNFWVIAVIVIFQPELRRMLEHLGKTTLSNRKKDDADGYTNMINNIERAVFNLSKTSTGALIVIARNYRLNEFYEKGTKMDAIPTSALFITAFVDGTPLHDGAMIIEDGRVKAANCVLPLTEQDISNDYGTRHRAALGITEQCDAISVVVSEETGTISICANGTLKKYSDRIKFRADLTKLLTTDDGYISKEKRWKFWKHIKKEK